jgi:hypothetical protein
MPRSVPIKTGNRAKNGIVKPLYFNFTTEFWKGVNLQVVIYLDGASGRPGAWRCVVNHFHHTHGEISLSYIYKKILFIFMCIIY